MTPTPYTKHLIKGVLVMQSRHGELSEDTEEATPCEYHPDVLLDDAGECPQCLKEIVAFGHWRQNPKLETFTDDVKSLLKRTGALNQDGTINKPSNVCPNTYRVSFTTYKGERKETIEEGLTKEEAINKVRSRDLSIKDAHAELIRRLEDDA